ncbi:hypothetical protein RSOLAG22IIIB_07136 [Rhizoctonia solani]|uniref:CBF1-interacting co-repressor CIR N-terminal domain-containing protein n=1 Tax=Rhizoctonia solani TaxID=456999 RepID=A0A0K6GJ28_9AGAM|nr:hypothetical protein RSOLAG22IIIB_07136 [Rhizoctonia solani]
MGKLNIAHHKSYHPYRADNIERVRRDEEEARLKEAIEDGRVSLADSEARISLLRERAKTESKPSKHKQQREEEKLLQSRNPLIAGSSEEDHHVSKEKGQGGALTLTAASGHVNFFEELEYSHQNTLEHGARTRTKAEIDKAREKELERGVPLMPDDKDRRPWYMDKALKHLKDMTDEEAKSKEQPDPEPELEREKWGKRRGNKTSSKTRLDPLKDMQTHLAARSRALSSRSHSNSNPMPPPSSLPARASSSNSSGPKDPSTERTTREAAERARAEALIAKRQAEKDAASSVGGDTPYSVRDGGYSDVYNKNETREAHHAWDRQRGRYSDRRWDEERDGRDRRDDGKERRRSESRRDDYADREWDRERPRDLPRGERNRTRGVDDVRYRS